MRQFAPLIAVLVLFLPADGQVEAEADSAAPAPATAPATATATGYYEPPDLQRHWEAARELVKSAGPEGLTEAKALEIIDALAEAVQGDVDSLIVRVRAFEGREGGGYTHKYFSSPLTRETILGREITVKAAAQQPHFHAVYGPHGYLLRVRYVEPGRWRARQAALAGGKFQPPSGSPPLVRYFRQWDFRNLKGKGYVRKKKRLEGRSYFRALHDGQDIIQQVQHYNTGWQLQYTLNYRRDAEGGSKYVELIFEGDGSGSLIDVHPYLFISSYSLVKPGWQVAITTGENDTLRSVQVLNGHGQISYYYTYSSSVDEETKKRTIRGTVLSAEGEIRQVFALIYDKKDRLERQAFYTSEGEIVESTTFKYPRLGADVLAVRRNAAGIVTDQWVVLDPVITDR